MKIALLRHAKVKFHEPFLSTAESFFRDRALYDFSPLVPPGIRVSWEEFPECFVSTMHRAQGTARMVYEGNPITWLELVEVENTPLLLPRVAMPTVIRRIISRIAWFFNCRRMLETRRESMARARLVVQYLLANNHADTLLVTHGFFMRCLQHELHKFGFRGNIGLYPHHAELYVFEME